MFDHEENELLDVVNERDEATGTIRRSDITSLRSTTGRYIRAAELFLQRPDGDIYLPRRSEYKKLFPGTLDLSAAGHPHKNESYEQAMIREVHEELGIDTSVDDLIFIKKFPPTETLFYFRKLFLLRTDEAPTLSAEHTEAVWLAPEKLYDYIASDLPPKDSLLQDLDALIAYLNSQD